MKIFKKIRYIRNYIARYRILKENQRKRDLMNEHYERSAFEYLCNHDFNKDNRALLYLRELNN